MVVIFLKREDKEDHTWAIMVWKYHKFAIKYAAFEINGKSKGHLNTRT